MRASLDAYTVRARLFPALIAGVPAFALAGAFISWGSFNVTQLIAGSGLTVLLVFFAEIARRRGRAIEPGLIERMGGLQSTVTLRHGNPTYDAATKAKYHAFLAARLEEPAPTPQSEEADPQAADAFYSRAGTWLRENTRNAKKFNILFNENISYGFWRNLLGLKAPALVLNGVIVIICSAVIWRRGLANLPDGFEARVLPVIVVAVLHTVCLVLFVREKNVAEAARTYARQLHLSIHSPELSKLHKTPGRAARTSKPRSVKPG